MENLGKSLAVGVMSLGVLRMDPNEYEEVHVTINGLTRSQIRRLGKLKEKSILEFAKNIQVERGEDFLKNFGLLIERRWANCGYCGGDFVPEQDDELARLLKRTHVSRWVVKQVNDPAKSGLFCSSLCERDYDTRTRPTCSICLKKVKPKPASLALEGVCSNKCFKRLPYAYTCRSCEKTFTKQPGKKLKEWHESGFCSKRCAQQTAVLATDELIMPDYIPAWRTVRCPQAHEFELPTRVRYPYRFFCEKCQKYYGMKG